VLHYPIKDSFLYSKKEHASIYETNAERQNKSLNPPQLKAVEKIAY
jgi:hypothetical protein